MEFVTERAAKFTTKYIFKKCVCVGGGQGRSQPLVNGRACKARQLGRSVPPPPENFEFIEDYWQCIWCAVYLHMMHIKLHQMIRIYNNITRKLSFGSIARSTSQDLHDYPGCSSLVPRPHPQERKRVW